MTVSRRDIFRRIYADLSILALFCLLTGAFIYLFPLQPMRGLFGLGFIFFAPGYATLAALYPDFGEFSKSKRFFASFGFSVVVSGLISLAIIYSEQTNLDMSYGLLLAWTGLMLLFAGLRRLQLPALDGSAWGGAWPVKLDLKNEHSRLAIGLRVAQGLTILLISLAAGRLWMVTYQNPARFSEFYILGRGGLLGEYPETLSEGEAVSLSVGVVSHLAEPTLYRIYARVDESELFLLEQFTLRDEQRWESDLSFPIEANGEISKLSLLLFTGDRVEPVHRLHVWLDPDE